MSEQNRDEHSENFSDPTSPSPDPQWGQGSGSTPPPPPPPPPAEWQSPSYQSGSETDDAPTTPDHQAQPDQQDPAAPPVPPLSGTYGTPPPPSGSPYPPEGQQSPYGASPYGDPNAPYGTPPPGYYTQAPPQSNTSALVLTILSGIGMFACCGVTIVSLILGIVGLTKQATDPVQSAKLTKWGWIAFAVGLGLAVIGFIVYVFAIASLGAGSEF